MTTEPRETDAPTAAACREALYMAADIAALAVLPGSQLSDEEALRPIAALVRSARRSLTGSGGSAPCADVLRRLAHLTSRQDPRALDDPAVTRLFDAVVSELRTADADVFDA